MPMWMKEKPTSMVPSPEVDSRLYTREELDRAVREAVEAERAQCTVAAIEDLPQDLRDAIYIEDCHMSGEHDPTHTPRYVCQRQLAQLAERVLGVLGINLNGTDANTRAPDSEYNKIPRRLNRAGWYAYYVEQRDNPSLMHRESDHARFTARVEELERWERDGVDLGKRRGE